MIKSINGHNTTIIIEKDGKIIAKIDSRHLNGVIDTDGFKNVMVSHDMNTIKLEV